MGNCLVTKLKDSVNNNDLPIFGGLLVNVTPNTPSNLGQNVMRIQNTSGIKLKTADGLPHIAEVQSFGITEVPALVSEVTIDTDGTRLVYFDSTVAYNVHLLDKYTIKRLDSSDAFSGQRPFGFDLGELKYTSSLFTLYALYEAGVTGTLKDIEDCTELTQLYLQGTSVVGDVKDLNKLTKLSLLGLRNTHINISGQLDYLVDAKAAVATSGQTLVIQGNNVCTLDGTVVSTEGIRVTFDGAGGYTVSNL